MPIVENTSKRLVLKAGSTSLTLDRDAAKAVLERKRLLWSAKPLEVPLSDVTDVKVEALTDRASGIEMCSTMLTLASGAAWALPAADKEEAQSSVDAVKKFLH